MNTAMVDYFDVLSLLHHSGDRSQHSNIAVLDGGQLDTSETLTDAKAGRAEAILVEGIKRGEEHAFSELVERFHSPLLRVAMTFVHCEAVAEEVVQDTWMAVLEGIHRFEGRSSLKTWIFRILINRAKTQGVRESRYMEFPVKWNGTEQKEVDSFDDSFALGAEGWPASCLNMISSQTDLPADQQIMNKELVQRIAGAIHMLPAMQRKVILLRDVEGFESEEVCRLLGLSDTNQRVLLHRARTKVRQALRPYLEPQEPEPLHPWPLKQCA
ncbi:MAG TPA: sigma-70 family RNA polymerase sigma factor [Nitrospirales bacterium]|nr:sigma-70 family RNA polymerase sigma factor [Nitrospirales bacterium]